jgi:phosphopantothenoylcysteine decarboxylase/phosphopantothenate--cysteine ligase
MDAKRADLIVVNDVGRKDIGFDAADNEVLIVPRGQPAESVEKASKREVAERIWDAFLRERRRQASERSASTVHLSDAHPNERREG